MFHRRYSNCRVGAIYMKFYQREACKTTKVFHMQQAFLTTKNDAITPGDQGKLDTKNKVASVGKSDVGEKI